MRSTSLFIYILLAVAPAVTFAKKAPSFPNTVYLIRHGEKPSNGSNGLSPQGEERAECLTNVFGPNSGYNIGKILAQKPKSNGKRTRPLETVTPLAQELGLTVDTSCKRDDQGCVADDIASFAKSSSANILVCWEHDALTDILKALGVKNPPDYPDDAFDIIWTVKNQTLTNQSSENCPGLDD